LNWLVTRSLEADLVTLHLQILVARSLKQTWRDNYIYFETLLDIEGAGHAFVSFHVTTRHIDDSTRRIRPDGPAVTSPTLWWTAGRRRRYDVTHFRHFQLLNGQTLRVVGRESADVRRPAFSDGSLSHPRRWR